MRSVLSRHNEISSTLNSNSKPPPAPLDKGRAQTVVENGNWQITFEFENGSSNILACEDYH